MDIHTHICTWGGRDPVKFADKLTQLAKSEDPQFLAFAARVEQVRGQRQGWVQDIRRVVGERR